jgi:hypothetical protein
MSACLNASSEPVTGPFEQAAAIRAKEKTTVTYSGLREIAMTTLQQIFKRRSTGRARRFAMVPYRRERTPRASRHSGSISLLCCATEC